MEIVLWSQPRIPIRSGKISNALMQILEEAGMDVLLKCPNTGQLDKGSKILPRLRSLMKTNVNVSASGTFSLVALKRFNLFKRL